MEDAALMHIHTDKTQTRLHFSAVWSGVSSVCNLLSCTKTVSDHASRHYTYRLVVFLFWIKAALIMPCLEFRSIEEAERW